MTSYYPAAPDQTVWWDVAGTVESLLARKRLQPGDRDRSRLGVAVAVAGRLINDHLDATVVVDPDDVPANIQAALEELAVAVYGRKDVSLSAGRPFDEVATSVSAAFADTVATLLGGEQQRWGLA